MEHPSKVKRLNHLLRQELGQHPLYSWQWSEDLLHVMDAINEDGSPVYEQKELKSGLVAVAQATRTRKICPDLDVWVMCAMIDTGRHDGAIHSLGTKNWYPVSDRSSRTVNLPTDVVPDETLTWEFINQMRHFREKEAAKLDAQYIERHLTPVPVDESRPNSKLVSRQEKADWERYYDEVKDLGTAFGQVPGTKEGVSFGGIKDTELASE